MIVYNVTVKIDKAVHDEWLQWMKSTHIPEVLATGYFVSNRMCRILGQDDSDGITYAIQYDALSIEDVETYHKEFAPALQKEHTERYKNKVVAFRTLMAQV